MNVAISGASGLIGSRLAVVLRDQGHTVYRLVRLRPVHGPLEIYWNYEAQEIDIERLEGLDVVVHLAGKALDEQRWTPAIKADVYASRVDGTAFISKALARLKRPPRLLISASATDYYAESDSPVGEAEGHPGTGFVAEMCRDWEAATEPAARAGIRVVVIRIPSVLASAGHSILAAVLPLFRRGLGPVLGSGKQLMCFISLEDLIRAIEHIMGCDDITGPVNVLTPQPVSQAEFARALGRVLHRPVFLKLPASFLRLAMGEIAGAILAGDTPLRPEKLLATGFRFDFPDIDSALRHELSLADSAAGRPLDSHAAA